MIEDTYTQIIELDLETAEDTFGDGLAHLGGRGVLLETTEGVQIFVPYSSLAKLIRHPLVEERVDQEGALGW